MKKSILGFVAAIFVVTISLVWYGCTKEVEEPQGSIYGFVTDYATGLPIGNVSVRLRPSGETTLTGNNGAYEFKNLEAGNYSLFLSKAEYADFDDDSIIVLEAGKSMPRDIQMRKLMASLLITDMTGDTLNSLDFGSDEYVTSKSFNIFNNGTITISCQIFYSCIWIDTAIAAGATIAPGQTMAVTVIIDRAQLSAGENRTYLHIISNNGNNELLITAIGPGAPTVTTNAVSNPTATSAVCGGNVTSDGGSAVTDRGICWATFNAPSLENGSYLSNGTGVGTFSSTMSNLSPNTVYYVRAFATNVRGTSYGEERQFTTNDGMPTVTINAVTNVTATSAVCGGSISDNGGFAVTDKGLVWSTSQYPTLNDNHISLGSGNTPFSGSMTNLLMGTTYYVRAYATNANGTAYSDNRTFSTTNGLPTVSTDNVTNIAAASAVCGGSISNDGGYAISDKGLVWGTSQMPTLSDNHISLGSGTAPFSGTLTNLSLSTTYYVRAYATNINGPAYGEQRTFTTTNGLPTVVTITPIINGTIVTTGGNVTSDGGYSVIDRGICYGTLPYPDLSSSYNHTNNGDGAGLFSSQFNLTVGDGVYYIRAYATNSNGTTYGQQDSVVHPYDELPSFSFNGHIYKVAPDPGSDMLWNNANSYCENLNAYGYTDWRMPTNAELAYMCQNKNSIGGFGVNQYYWSSTIYSTSPYTSVNSYVIIEFGTGCNNSHVWEDHSDYIITIHVRPIRIDQY